MERCSGFIVFIRATHPVKYWQTSPETMENLEGKSTVSMFEEKNKMESRSSIESDGSIEVGTWKDESDFFELAGMKEIGARYWSSKTWSEGKRGI
ncbi:hypothetical protein VIGAN_05167800 [Vigna angularis var. angularis]|uniref:Uncharacterized protein n=1 Tax=Vigna angularis var. angularis TaxID=157739 RepID=A0A0S3S5Y0_PHAAN|nr:hypothetical protein VIGAN_05167800 [Vigna angularis var. angularis]